MQVSFEQVCYSTICRVNMTVVTNVSKRDGEERREVRAGHAELTCLIFGERPSAFIPHQIYQTYLSDDGPCYDDDRDARMT